MGLDVTTTLAEVVDTWPELARELERRGLDYCCGGQRTLGDACVASGLDPARTVAELASVAPTSSVPAAWASMSADALVDHLESVHHRYLWDELPRITALVEKIVAVHGSRHPELAGISSTFAAIRADLEPHLVKEERVLFPLIREAVAPSPRSEAPVGSLRAPISVMLREHDEVGELLASLRRSTDGYRVPADGCATYTACFAAMEQLEVDTHLHIHKENNVLFPLVERLEGGRVS